MASFGPAPEYDLLFSIDYNDVPYENSNSPGIVIRVKNQRAKVIFRGWGGMVDIPNLYVCEADTGRLREIPIAWRPTPPAGFAITVPELEARTIDTSSIARNGYRLSEIDFAKTYGILDVVMADRFSPFPPHKVLREDNYKACLQHVAGNQVGLTVHFIGWILADKRR